MTPAAHPTGASSDFSPGGTLVASFVPVWTILPQTWIMGEVHHAHLYPTSTWSSSSPLQPPEAPYLHSQALTLYCISWSRRLRGTVLYSVLSARIKGTRRLRPAPIHSSPITPETSPVPAFQPTTWKKRSSTYRSQPKSELRVEDHLFSQI